jgi:GDP-4-dehydro-6-deoxy-D-mannose reductase
VRALVTGARGFVGPYLTAHLEAAGDEVVGFGPEVDITDGEAIRDAVAAARPDAVYHLAAASHVGSSWSAPVEVLRTNAEGTLNVLLAAEAAGAQRVLVVGSAEEYGIVEPSALPLTETSPLRPVTPYGASKVAAEVVGLQAFLGRGLPVVLARPFNHLGPGQSDRLVASTLAHQVARNEHEGTDVVLAGDLTPRRDFTDVRDVVRAYRLLVTEGQPGEAYNVCSGVDVPVSEVADALIAEARRPMRVELDPSRLRPVELPALRGDPGKLRAATGWAPEIPLERTLSDLLGWWRQRVAEDAAAPSR